MNIKCTRKEGVLNTEDLKWQDYLENHFVYSESLKWEPIESQIKDLKKNKPELVHDKILIAQLEEN